MSLRSLITGLKDDVKKTFSGVDTNDSLVNKFARSKAMDNMVGWQQLLSDPKSKIKFGQDFRYNPQDSTGKKALKLGGNIVKNVGESVVTMIPKVGYDLGQVGKGIVTGKTDDIQFSSAPAIFGEDFASYFATEDMTRNTPTIRKPFDTVGYYKGQGKWNVPFTQIKLPELGLTESSAFNTTKKGLQAFEAPLAAYGLSNPAKMLGMLGFGSGISGLVNFASSGAKKGSFEEGAWKTAYDMAPTVAKSSGLLGATDKITTLGSVPMQSLTNVLQGVAYDQVSGSETTGGSIFIDALFPVAGYLKTKAFNSFGDAAKNVQGKILESLGKKLRKSDGTYTTLAKWVKGTRPYRKGGAGALFGFEIYQDENGNWKADFNSKKALLGMAVMVGDTKALNSIDSKFLGGTDNAGKNELEDILKAQEVKGGDLKVKDAGKSYIEMPKNKEEAVKKLKAIQDYPNVLRDLGFDKDTINKTSYKKSTKMMDDVLESGGGRQQNIDETTLKGILSEEEIPSFKQKWNSAFNKIKNTPKEIQRLLTDTRTKNLVGRADANQYALKFKDIPEEDGWKMIQFMQNPSPETAKRLNFEPNKYQNEMAEIRKTFDTLRQEAIDKGIDVGYLDNYVNQVWKEDAGEIARRMSISKNPSFAKEKKWPSYEVGMKSIKENGLGLTPKYTHPAQLVAHYKYQMERALANVELVNGLKDSGYILPSKEAPNDWKYLDIMGLGEDLRAPNNIADAVNTMFDKGSGGLMEIPAKISKYMQDITLSGGYKQFNAFTLGQVIKEVTSGRVKSPLKALFMTDSGLKNYADINAKYIKMASEEGINTRLATDYDKMFDNLTESKSLTKIIGEKWDNFISKPTFQKFMPVLQTEFFKDVYEKGIKEGLSPEQARKIAGDSTKNWYGLIDNFTRSKNVDNTLSALVFAPTYRESMVNFWVKNLQSVTPKNISNATFKQNRKFLAGTAVTFVLFELLNKQLTGHWMHENKEGKGVSIEVPVGKERSWFIPILPSVGTVPRRLVEMGDALVKGDTRTMMQKAGSFLSQPVSLGSQLLSNRTFYGGPIYEEEDNALQRFGKLGGYALEQSSHPFIGEPLAAAQGRKTPTEGLLGMAELPIYPSKSSNATHLTSKEAKTYRELNKSDPKKAQKYWDEQKNAYDETKAREKVKSTGEPITVNGKYIYKKDDGELGSVILERDITPPKLTGQPQLDKEKISDYKTKLSNRANDIVKLYELGLLTEEEAEKELTKIIEIKESLKTTKSSSGKKAKKVDLAKISQNTLKTVKVSSKSPKFNTFEILSNYKKTKMPEIKTPNLKVIDFKTAKLKKGTK